MSSASPVATFSRFIDVVFERIFVESRFLPRRIDDQIEWLHRATATLSSLEERQLFVEPKKVVMRALGQGRYRGIQTQQFLWDKPEIEAASHFGLDVKTTEPRVTLFGTGNRPIWLLVHGWLGGSRLMDEVFWPLRGLFRTHDVALILLPGHGARSMPASSLLPTFPSRNPIRNLLGLLTAVTETRQLIAWLRERGYEHIGVAGTSLGVQVAALLATVDTSANRYLFDRPLAHLNEPLRRRAQEGATQLLDLHQALLGFYRPVSPLSRKSLVSPEQVDVLLGREDRVAGCAEGEGLARHFGVEAKIFPTGHVLSIGRESMILELMCKLGKPVG